MISHGVLLRGAQGSGGELGHVTIHATGPRCASRDIAEIKEATLGAAVLGTAALARDPSSGEYFLGG